MLVCVRVDVVFEQTDFLSSFRVRNGVFVKSLAYLALKASPDVRINEWRLFFVFLAL